MKPKLLLIELWGLGDLVLATTLIDAARLDFEVHLLAKPVARELLGPTYPDVFFHPLVAGWTAHHGKYHVWKWDWAALGRVLYELQRERFDYAVSVRPDPRDHLLMWLAGARTRVGFPTKGSELLLHRRLHEPVQQWHRVESWQHIAAALGLSSTQTLAPRLSSAAYRTAKIDRLVDSACKPVITLHLGAGQPVRRWPESYWYDTIETLRQNFDFHLILAPDKGYGCTLSALADTTTNDLTVTELVDLAARSELLLSHDSGPMHIAAACGTPTISIFGPGNPSWFRPWGENHRMIIRDLCPLRPCFDNCQFAENYCLTRLLPADVGPEIVTFVQSTLSRAAYSL